MDFQHRTDPLLIGFITLSLLLHLLLLYLVPQRSLLSPPPSKERPVEVELRPQQPRERELDLPEKPDQSRTRPAKRLGPSDQQVEKETAPPGKEAEDRTPHAPARPAKPEPKPSPKPQPKSPAAEPETKPQPQARVETRPARPEAEAPQTTTQAPPLPKKMPSIDQLLTLPQATTERIVSDWRRKHREDVARGDAVWLDTERDLLYSFFKRFRDGIYRVWNYPRPAAERGEEGVCLLKITVRRDGTVDNVKLVESSGSPALDNEALAAVRRGGPYGDLPSAYPEKELNIFAFFRYSLTRQNSRRPGDIF